ncbi:MAG TPA: hypothetical protein GXZ82_09580 [Firmicutes bacterium]|jgi:hypothetical protein|nr:hypothetical protein [Bacillota bacterium]
MASYRDGRVNRNLVPSEPGITPSYWCTWAAQNYAYGQGAETLDYQLLEGKQGALLARNALNEEQLFGEKGWLRTFYPGVRGDLLVVLDDGWDVPFDIEQQPDYFGCLELSVERFPSFTGEPSVRLAQLSRAVRNLGWKGLGLWVAAQEAAGAWKPGMTQEGYWRERLRWSHAAGIKYWKVDWGKHAGSPGFRRMLTALARQEAPELIIEHIKTIGPENAADGRAPQEFIERIAGLSAFAAVVRTYDVTAPLSIPTTLDRTTGLLASAPAFNGSGLINCEDEPYIAAALGCAIGVMRHPLIGLRPQGDLDPFFGGPHCAKRRLDEVVRAVRWQRSAPACGFSEGAVEVDERILWDEWTYKQGETWRTKLVGERLRQGAPARVARGLPLPQVAAEGEPPYVVASHHPNGAVAIAALPRTSPELGSYMPAADVTLDLSAFDSVGPIGVFGRYRSLTLQYPRSLRNARVWAQDLAADWCVEITADVELSDNRLCVPGKVISHIGIAGAASGDLSAPGMVLVVE